MKKLITLIATLGTLGASGLHANELSIDSTFGWESEFVFRGLQRASTNFEASIDASFAGAYAGFWTVLPIDSKESMEKWFVFNGGYELSVTDWLTLDGGARLYYFPSYATEDTHFEPYLGAQFETAPFHPAVYLFHNFENDDTTFEVSGSYDVSIVEQLDARFGAHWGHIWRDVGRDYMYAGVSADLVYAFTEFASGSIGARLSANELNSTDPELAGIATDTNLWWGFSFSAGF